MMTDKFLKKDIEDMIRNTELYSIGYIRGYINACYFLKGISYKTKVGLNKFLAENIDNKFTG